MRIHIGAATVKSRMEIPQKLKNGLAFDPALPLLGIYLKEPKTLIQKNKNIPMFIAVIYDHQDMEAAQVSISR